MARSAGGSADEGPRGPAELPQHPFVDRLKPDPSQPAKRVIVLTGLPGSSDRPGYQRLYLTAKLDYYAEFLSPDIVHAEAVPADRSPFPDLEATRVSIDRNATIHYIWARSPQPVDEFDLDIRLGAAGAALPIPPPTVHTCPDGTACGTCDGTCDVTCLPQHTCHTCAGQHTCQTCATCQTHCNQNTCVNTQCNQNTCVNTQCNQNTCHTCQTQCNQNTCANTQCNQATCHTCQTQCNQHTCQTCHTCNGTCDTCHHTCATCIHPHCFPP
jgi:hypothetical protein